MNIRKYRPTDREPIKAITAICFEDVSIDHAIEARFGQVDGKDWRYRKVRHIDDDIAANADGIFIAEESAAEDTEIVGYITTRIDHDTKIGGIPNLGVLPHYRGRGIGRQLIETAIRYARAEGMIYIRIETLAQNPIGQYLYPSCGFEEIARQVHYIMPLAEVTAIP